MSEHGLTADNILDCLPEALARSQNMRDLAASIVGALEEQAFMTDATKLYINIDMLPEPLLDILAYDFKVDWYDYNYDIATKRKLLKTSFDVHRHLGTRKAVETAVQAVFPYSVVQEWYEYGGDPYCFRLVVNTTDHDEQEILVDGLLRAITMYKSYRSHLDNIMYRSYSVIKIITSTGYIVYANRLCGTYPSQATQGAIDHNDIIIETASGNAAESIPPTGTVDAGTHPATATQGAHELGDIVILSDTVEAASAVPHTGTINAGTHPDGAAGEPEEGGGIVASTSGTSFISDTPLCGSAPGDLF